MAAHRVVAFDTIGHLPRVDTCILIVIHKPLHPTVQVEEVSIANLLPTSAPWLTGEVCQRRISAPVTSRPQGVAVQWITRYRNVPISYAPFCG